MQPINLQNLRQKAPERVIAKFTKGRDADGSNAFILELPFQKEKKFWKMREFTSIHAIEDAAQVAFDYGKKLWPYYDLHLIVIPNSPIIKAIIEKYESDSRN